jgi:hypothetical protein
MYVRVDGGTVDEVRLDIFEPPRFSRRSCAATSSGATTDGAWPAVVARLTGTAPNVPASRYLRPYPRKPCLCCHEIGHWQQRCPGRS